MSTVKDIAMVTTALKTVLWWRDHSGRRVGDGLIHHSDAGSQNTSIAFAEILVWEGIAASIGSIGGGGCGTCEVYPANWPPALLRRVTHRGISPVHGDIA
jgi:hypothetical protein